MSLRRARHGAVLLGVAVLVLGLTACAEKPPVPGQPLASRAKADAKPWEGQPTAFAAPELQKGDRDAWAKALRTRAESQNEYVRSR
jgi:hypothetical protein